MMGKNGESAEGNQSGESTNSLSTDQIVQQSVLLPGDVLLYRSDGQKLHQRKISEATGSPYIHAAIYLGDGLVAESNVPNGVGEHPLADSIEGCRCVAVLRSQLGFAHDRPQKLRTFVDAVLAHKKLYDFVGVLKFKRKSEAYFDHQLDFIRENYGRVTSHDEFAEQSFFCSAFVVACYAVVGVIGDSAQVAYQPDNFSPGQLHRDPTFGWLLGFLVPEGGSVPEDDPVLTQATLWRDCLAARWW